MPASPITRSDSTAQHVIEPGDRDLERGFLAHERWAFEAFYARYSKTFYAAAYGVLKSEQEAQDCVHDVLLRLWRKPSAFVPGKGSLKAFTAVCIRNDAVSRLRISHRAPELVRRLSSAAREEDFEPVDFVERERLTQAIRALPPAQRRAIVMAYFQHFTHREIAAALNEPIGTIKSRLSAALHRLHAALSEGFSHE